MRGCFVLFQMFLKVGWTGRLQRAKVRHCGGLAAPGPLRDALPTEYLLPESPRLGPGPRAHSRPFGLPPCAWPLRDCLPGIPPTLRPPIRAQVRLRRPEGATVQVAVLTRRPKSPAPLHSRRPFFPRASRSRLRTMESRPGSKGDLTCAPRVWRIWEASVQEGLIRFPLILLTEPAPQDPIQTRELGLCGVARAAPGRKVDAWLPQVAPKTEVLQSGVRK